VSTKNKLAAVIFFKGLCVPLNCKISELKTLVKCLNCQQCLSCSISEVVELGSSQSKAAHSW